MSDLCETKTNLQLKAAEACVARGQAVAALVQPANVNLTPEEVSVARATLKQPAVTRALISAAVRVDPDPRSAPHILWPN